RDYDDDPALAELSTINYLTPDFPPTFITGGNADALTDQQSKPFASRLKQLDVDTRTLFFPSDYTPALGHEYQFNLDIAAGKKALHEIVAFSRDHTRSKSRPRSKFPGSQPSLLRCRNGLRRGIDSGRVSGSAR